MRIDPLSPFAPARVRALVLPVGRVKRARFTAFHELLMREGDVTLSEIADDDGANQTMFSPKSFPKGMVLYDFALSASPESHMSIAPFELFRGPMVIIGIGDAQEYPLRGDDPTSEADLRLKEFQALASSVQDQFPRILVHRVVFFDDSTLDKKKQLENLVLLPQNEDERLPMLRNVVLGMTVSLHIELSSYAKSIQALPSVASPAVPPAQTTQPQWHGGDSPVLSRTASNHSERSGSPSLDQKDLHRQSMPVFPSGTNFADPSSRLDSPSTRRPPAQTFEEIAGTNPTPPGARPVEKLRPRPGSVITSREGSRDRVTVQGFGSDSFSEKSRNKGKGRVGVVIASIYLLAGRWDEAFKLSIDSGLKSRAFSDHIWHAKALENIAISMALLAWSGMEFQIPAMCHPSADHGPNSKPAPINDLETKVDNPIKSFENSQARTTLLKILTSLMPVLTNMILSIYGRAVTAVSGDFVPQLVLSECTIRLSKFLAMINIAGGLITDEGLSHLILGTPLTPSSDLSLSRLKIYPRRQEITTILGRAFPGPVEQSGLSPVDNVMILAGIASVFSSLGMQRKKAMVMKEFLSALIPGLHQARMAGAAEAGIHPSAGLSALARASDLPDGEVDRGLEDFLNVVCQIYGIPESKWTRSIGSELLQEATTNGTTNGMQSKPKQLPVQLVGNFVLRSFGSINIKADVLRACIQLCEALPDYRGILHYSSLLLRTAGPGIAPSAETSDVLVNLSREEQLHLANNIFRTVMEAKSAGYDDIEAEYWDEFLIRGFFVLEPSPSALLRPHQRADLKKAKIQTRDPFIHNPFLDKTGTAVLGNLLAANDEREFVVALQNPFDFEVEVESLKLIAEGVDLNISKHNFILRPYRTQSFSLTGRVPKDGVITVNGCVVKIKGCRERLFPIFGDPWTPEADTKVKNIGLLNSLRPSSRHRSNPSTSSLGIETQKRSFPIPATISLNVIPEQPNLAVLGSSVSENALMLLEGERRAISITIQNLSTTTAADFLHISFRDTASDVMQDALNQKGIPPTDMYEIEFQLANLPAISALPNQPTSIAPEGTATFRFQVLAKPGLTSASIQFDYANLSTPHTENEDSFFTREISYPISITVNASVQVHRLEIVPLSAEFSWQVASRDNKIGTAGGTDDPYESIVSTYQRTKNAEEHCLLLLDLRNNWPFPLNTSIQVQNLTGAKELPGEEDIFGTSSNLILPGQISRQIQLIPKIYISKPHIRIKPISPAHQRQFVVSAEKISTDVEQTSRECFWFREALLTRLNGTWMQEGESDGRSGFIDLRGIRLSARMVDALKLPDVGISFTSEGSEVKRTGKTKFQGKVDEFFTVHINVHNRSLKTIFPLLRLRPSLADQPREIALDVSKRFAWSGVLQRALPHLPPGGVHKVQLPVCALCAGEFEIGAVVEEIKEAEGLTEEREKEPVLDDLVESVGRRTWTAGEPCRIVAFDDESE